LRLFFNSNSAIFVGGGAKIFLLPDAGYPSYVTAPGGWEQKYFCVFTKKKIAEFKVKRIRSKRAKNLKVENLPLGAVQKFVQCVRTNKEVELSQFGHFSDKGEIGQFFAILCGRPLYWTAPYFYLFIYFFQ